MKRIFLPIEIKVREFHSKMLFSLIAAERGFETILGGQLELIDRMPRLGRGIYIDKSTAITKREWFHRCRGLGNYVAAWDEEGLVYLSDEVYHTTRMDPEAFAQTDLFFAWGPHHQRTVLSQYPDMKEKVVVVGNPRIDLLRPEFRGYCDHRVDELRARYGRMLLINTNFALHNFVKGGDAATKIFDPYPLRNKSRLLQEWYDFQRQGYEAFQGAILAIHDHFPEHTIVVRPCPAEAMKPWVQLMENKPRGVVSKEGNVVEWIRAAEASVQFNCTTGVEAYLLGKPSIAYRAVRSAEYETPLPIACSYPAFTQEELLDRLERIVSTDPGKGSCPDNGLSDIEEHLGLPNGPTACEHILAEIQRRAFPERHKTLPSVPLLKRVWRHWLRLVRRHAPEDLRYYREKFPGLELKEARRVAKDFSLATDRFQNIRISSVSRNIIRVHPA